MGIVSFLEDPEIVKKILKHLGLWDFNPPEVRRVKARPRPKTKRPSPDIHIDYSDSQIPQSDDYLYADVEHPEAISA